MSVFTLAPILLLSFFLPGSLSSNKYMPEHNLSYDGAQVLEIRSSPFVKKLVQDYGLDVWKSNNDHVEAMVRREIKFNVSSLLSKKCIPFSVKIQNLGEAIKNENPSSLWRRQSSLSEFSRYQRLSAIHDYLDYLAEKYPQIVSVGIMGYTFENRPLKYIKISSGKPNAKVVFIDGGIHAREWVSISSVTYIIGELVENSTNLPSELFELDFYIIPVLNPDGYEYSHTTDRMWRKNRSENSQCYGVDLNRNFDIHFGQAGVSEDPCSDIYCGNRPNSELETKSLSSFLLNLKGNLKAYITFHSFGQYILIPYGYKTGAFPPDFYKMKRVGEKASRAMRRINRMYYKVDNTAKALYPSSGGSDDWAKARTKADYVYTIELRDQGAYGFVLPSRFILPTAREALEAVKVIAMEAYKA